ncbi:MAG: hypothetical protein AAF267_05570 [Deinococcota bacterium]
MKYFPTIDKPIWGQAKSWQGIDRWETTLEFSHKHPVVQEVIPATMDLEASLHLRGSQGMYQLLFPGGHKKVTLEADDITLNVSNLLTTGKHLYTIQSEHAFTATVNIHATRPLVDTRDEGYHITWQTLAAGERQQMVGDRPAHRVGLWSRRLKILPADSRQTVLSGEQQTLTQAHFHAPLAEYHTDFSGVDVDVSGWPQVTLPHTWEDIQTEGYAWYQLELPPQPNWQGQQVVLRIEDIHAEILTYINGHTAGYQQAGVGQDRPLQFEVSEFLRWDAPNIITLRVSQQQGEAFNVPPVTLAPVKRYGVSLAGKLHPGEEDGLQIGVYAGNERLEPFGFSPTSQFLYRPPELRCEGLQTDDFDASVRALAHEDNHALQVEVISQDDTPLWVHVRLEAAKLNLSKLNLNQLNSSTLRIDDGSDDADTLYIHLPQLNKWRVTDVWDGTNIPKENTTISFTSSCELLLACEGSASLTVSRGRVVDDVSLEQTLSDWHDAVYSIARPVRMDDTQAAAWRSYKQTVLLNARNVPDDVAHGLLAAVDKPVFHVYWMRDCAISVPGAFYTGGDAARTALANIGDTLDRYAKVPECIGIYPDGSPREGGFSDGPALGIYAQGYGHALAGKAWLETHYHAVTQQLDYLLARDADGGDPLDGLIRSSQGDWKDAMSMRQFGRVGAVFFVNVAYLRALRVAAEMADALGKPADATRWRTLREHGITILNQNVADGGLWLPEKGYYADWVQVMDQKSWVYPQDADNVTIFSAFSSLAHGIALAEGIIPAERISQVVNAITSFGLLDPLPAPAKYPFYDVLGQTGHSDVDVAESINLSNPWQLKDYFPNLPDWLSYDMVLPWKGWPGNHVWGGRWLMAGAWLTLGLWRAGYTDLAKRAQNNLAKSLLRTRHPGRCEETESYSAVSREETGSHVDPAGYYQLWSGAVPLQALVEGQYGVQATSTGVSLDVRHYAVEDGMERVPIRGGTLSCRRVSEGTYQLVLDADTAGQLELTLPADTKLDIANAEALEPTPTSTRYRLAYQAHSELTLNVRLISSLAGQSS